MPRRVRRGIPIPGMLHRVVLGMVSQQVSQLFPPALGRRHCLDSIAGRTHTAGHVHSRQLHDRITPESSEQFRRSIFGVVQCYDCLPQHVVDLPSVKRFQRYFQNVVKVRVVSGHVGWQQIFVEGPPLFIIIEILSFLHCMRLIRIECVCPCDLFISMCS